MNRFKILSSTFGNPSTVSAIDYTNRIFLVLEDTVTNNIVECSIHKNILSNKLADFGVTLPESHTNRMLRGRANSVLTDTLMEFELVADVVQHKVGDKYTNIDGEERVCSNNGYHIDNQLNVLLVKSNAYVSEVIKSKVIPQGDDLVKFANQILETSSDDDDKELILPDGKDDDDKKDDKKEKK